MGQLVWKIARGTQRDREAYREAEKQRGTHAGTEKARASERSRARESVRARERERLWLNVGLYTADSNPPLHSPT